jgi:hypothetical protein
MYKRLLAWLAAAVFAVATVASSTSGAAVQSDTVIGGVIDAGGANVGFNARSDPNGENPSGHITTTIPFSGTTGDPLQLRIDVTCVAVAGNLAAVGGIISESSANDIFAGFNLVVVFRDTGLPGGEGDAVAPFPGAPAASCPAFVALAAEAPPIQIGNVTVNDAT